MGRSEVQKNVPCAILCRFLLHWGGMEMTWDDLQSYWMTVEENSQFPVYWPSTGTWLRNKALLYSVIFYFGVTLIRQIAHLNYAVITVINSWKSGHWCDKVSLYHSQEPWLNLWEFCQQVDVTFLAWNQPWWENYTPFGGGAPLEIFYQNTTDWGYIFFLCLIQNLIT